MINGKRTTASLFRSWRIWCCLSGFGNESVEVIHDHDPRHPKQRFWETTMPGTLPQIEVARSRPTITTKDWVQEQLNSGETLVGYGKLDFPALRFNCGGQSSVQLGW